MEKQNNVIEFTPREVLSEEQIKHWMEVRENSMRALKMANKVLGIVNEE